MSIAAKRAIAAERRKKKDLNEPSLWRLLFGKKKQAQAPIQPEQKNKGRHKGRAASSQGIQSTTPAPAIVDEKDCYMSGALPVGAKVSRSDSSESQLVRTDARSKYLPRPLGQLLGPDAPRSEPLSRSQSTDVTSGWAPSKRPQISRNLTNDQSSMLTKHFAYNDQTKYNIGFTLSFHPKILMEYLVSLNCWVRSEPAVKLLVGALQLMDLSFIALKKPVTIFAYDWEEIETRVLIGGRVVMEQALEKTVTTLEMAKCGQGGLQVKFPGVQGLQWVPCRTLYLRRDPLNKGPTW